METVTMKLDALFDRWKNHIGVESNTFAEDGIIDEEKWNQEERKVMFLLKDVNNSKGDSAGNFREKVKKEPWPVVGSWAYGLQRVSKSLIIPFSEANKKQTNNETKQETNYGKGCLSSAIVNIDKIAGGPVGNDKKLQDAISRDKDFIIEQIELIQPSVIVCGATFHYLKMLYPDVNFNSVDPDHKCYEYKNKVCIDYCHPSARFPWDMMYYTLMCFYQNTLT